jgi:hypothetical protein
MPLPVAQLLDGDRVLQAVVAAAQNYAAVLTDRDPVDGDHVVPAELRHFLARLRLLHGVPFSYLVPDAALLPLESIRFFHVDRAWTDALVQGVLSVGTITTADRAQLASTYPHVRDEVDEAERFVRTPPAEKRLAGPGGAITGFLMRSRAVSGWPNLHVRAYRRDVLADDALTTEAESHPDRLKVLRLERLAPAVLLALFDGVPAVVHVEEPRQGIQFGVRIDTAAPPSQRRAKVPVRRCDTGASVPPANPSAPKGTLDASNSVDVPFRPGAPGVIDMAVLRDRLRAKAPAAGPTLDPNEFALQMLRFPYRQVFGDPNDLEQVRYYRMDAFKVEIPLTAWKAVIASEVTP